MSILIKNVILDDKARDILIEKGKIKKIGRNLNLKAKEKIDGKKEKAVLPGLINSHTHAAMTLLRGYQDNLPLKKWLEKIWAVEQKMTEDDVYWGTKLACLEMIKTGTTCFNDMYWYPEAAALAAEEMGIRGIIGLIMMDFDRRGSKENIKRAYNKFGSKKLNIAKLALAPHAIYTVSKENLVWAKNFAAKNDLILHIHLSETEEEVKDCRKKWKIGPVEYLNRIGFLGKNSVLAHTVWLSDKEIKVLGKNKCSVVYNPSSNLKLAVGEIFPYQKLKKAGINITLGTDGTASNNNLDMFEEMKIGALLQKHREKNPTIAKAKEVLNWTTINGAKAFKINSGEIKEGKLADLILVDLNEICFCPGYDFISDLVYSCSGNCVSDVVCDGKILMREKEVENEKEIIKKATQRAKKLIE